MPIMTSPADGAAVLILTPVKDATPWLDQYEAGLSRLTYPRSAISLGSLESDSVDGTFEALQRCLPALRQRYRRVGLWKRDFGYRLPPNLHRGVPEIQIDRRTVLARSRNHLLSHALDDEAWVLWLDVDVIEYPPDLIERLIAAGKEIVQPHCVLDYGGHDQGRLHLEVRHARW
jgi:hypothetical protein